MIDAASKRRQSNRHARRTLAMAWVYAGCLVAGGVPFGPLQARAGDKTLPEMVTIAPGGFVSASAEKQPARAVRIAYGFAASKYPITVVQFARFVRETGFDTGNHCYTHVGDVVHDTFTEGSWKNPKFPQKRNSPVVCVSWNEAQAYAAWLSKKTGETYRLLSEVEYEYVNRAGTRTSYWWGDAIGTAKANCKGCGSAWDDKRSSPVGSFPANPFGLHDTAGNVWSWTGDCWNADITAAPADGIAAEKGDCSKRAIRGGSYGHGPEYMLPTSRHSIAPDVHDQHIGFRIAKTIASPRG